VFVCGTDSKLWQNHFDNFGWTGWWKPVGDDGVLAGAPVAVSWAPTRVDVFVPGLDGVYHRFYDQGWNSSWEALGTPPVGLAPNTDLAVASWGPNRIDLFAVGADQKLYQKFTDGRTWSGWGVPPGTEAGSITAVGAASWGANQVAVFGRGTDSGLYWTNFYRGVWGAWQRIGNPGDVVINAPSAGSRGCQSIDVFVAGTDQRCYQFSYNGG
jgi:hypothetical protein